MLRSCVMARGRPQDSLLVQEAPRSLGSQVVSSRGLVGFPVQPHVRRPRVLSSQVFRPQPQASEVSRPPSRVLHVLLGQLQGSGASTVVRRATGPLSVRRRPRVLMQFLLQLVLHFRVVLVQLLLADQFRLQLAHSLRVSPAAV